VDNNEGLFFKEGNMYHALILDVGSDVRWMYMSAEFLGLLLWDA